MVCKSCLTENPEESVYCQNCGKRLDGKIPCSACNTMNSDAANFCISCGSKLNIDEQRKGDTIPRFTKIISLVGGAFAMSAILFMLIFTCLIGITSYPTGLGISVESVGIIDYLGKIYRSIDADTLYALMCFGGPVYPEADLYRFIYYYNAALGTLIAVATITCVLTFSILAIVRYVKSMMGNSEKSYTGFVVAAVISYFGGCIGIRALNAAEIIVPPSGISVSAATNFNSATIAGLILVLICFIGFVGCKIVCNAKKLIQEHGQVSFCLSGVCAILFGITLCLAASSVGSLSSSTLGNLRGGYYVITAYALLSPHYHTDPNNTRDFGIFGMPIQVILLVFLTIALAYAVYDIVADRGKYHLVYAILSFVFAVAQFVLGVFTWYMLGEGLYNTGSVYGNVDVNVFYVTGIVMLIFATAGLVLSIVHAVYLHKQRLREAYYQKNNL